MATIEKSIKFSILTAISLAWASVCLGDPPPPPEDAPSFIQRNSWEGSFDRSADATRAAELELKKGINITCDSAQFQNAGLTAAQVSQRVADCLKTQQEAKGYAEKTEGIRKTQRVLSDVSKVSDAAAAGAIGAAGYMELMHKDATQADNLRSVANIEEAAAYAAYASAATDFSLGAYAYLSHKQKLEDMKEKLAGEKNSQNPEAVEKLHTAAEATTEAAYNHMLYGVGKAAVGYTGMWLAKNNRKEAERLSSIDTTAVELNPALAAGNLPNNGPAYVHNNSPQISFPSGTNTGSGSTSVASSSPVISSSGASMMMPSRGSRKLASAKMGPAASGGGSNSLLSTGAGGGAAAGGSTNQEATAEPTKEALQSFEMSLSGGGPSYRGGNSGKAEGPSIPQLLSSLMGGEEPTKSAATGLNPNRMYREALAGGETQGSPDGIHESEDSSLFELIKAKHNKMLESGRLQGPGAVSVR